jgi:hypothetical protein
LVSVLKKIVTDIEDFTCVHYKNHKLTKPPYLCFSLTKS